MLNLQYMLNVSHVESGKKGDNQWQFGKQLMYIQIHVPSPELFCMEIHVRRA